MKAGKRHYTARQTEIISCIIINSYNYLSSYLKTFTLYVAESLPYT